MAKQREKATAFIVKYLDKLLPGNPDSARWKEHLDGLSDKAFEQFMLDLKNRVKFLTLTAPHGSKQSLSLERNVAVADELNIPLFQRLYLGEDETIPETLTPIEYLVVMLPWRLASQRLAKKASIPKTQRVINTLTGQPTGESKGASISYPEIRQLAALNMENSLVELLKTRGGDSRAGAALNASLTRTGRASLKTIVQFSSGVESTATLKTFLTCAHLKSTL